MGRPFSVSMQPPSGYSRGHLLPINTIAQGELTCRDLHLQVTLWNFLKYNVAGGGDSSLYGVESSTFYLRNALTNLNLVMPLALLVPLSALFLMSQRRGWSPPTSLICATLNTNTACIAGWAQR